MRDEFIKINEETKNEGRYLITDFSIPNNCKIINVIGIEVPFILIQGQNFIINRFATRKRINELIELDRQNNL